GDWLSAGPEPQEVMVMRTSPYHAEPSLTQLLTGIIDDAKKLVRQELALATLEIREGLRKTKTVMLSLSIGIGTAAIGGLPLCACYGIVGGMLAIVEGVLLFIGKSIIARVDVAPRQTMATMKENVRWIKKRATFDRT